MSRQNAPMITLTSDFGLKDYFVGVLKGVLFQSKASRVLDITHLVEKHDVASGAFILREISNYFAPGTIHLAIIDPGVGTMRRKLIAKYANQFFVAPDNGLISYFLKSETCEVFEVKEGPLLQFKKSPTFAGRDHFAPIAASLANGHSPEELGEKISDALCIEALFPSKEEGRMMGKIVYFDHFGNAITNLNHEVLGDKLLDPDSFCLDFTDKKLQGIKKNYRAGGEGEPSILMNSSGFLEIFVCCASARKILNLNLMDDVLIH
ncbi:MAG: SAM-dependent chlorinase/fluorinase [Nitrospirae bacterium]|nr:SAM-dependent chlorinase/fluorinase [Candidatus Manganitrophaceae bacterium]